jgi:hypothetical protein
MGYSFINTSYTGKLSSESLYMPTIVWYSTEKRPREHVQYATYLHTELYAVWKIFSPVFCVSWVRPHYHAICINLKVQEKWNSTICKRTYDSIIDGARCRARLFDYVKVSWWPSIDIALWMTEWSELMNISMHYFSPFGHNFAHNSYIKTLISSRRDCGEQSIVLPDLHSYHIDLQSPKSLRVFWKFVYQLFLQISFQNKWTSRSASNSPTATEDPCPFHSWWS